MTNADKQILFIIASPRIDGNTQTLINRIVPEIPVEQKNIKIIHISKINISPCIACGKCNEGKECVIEDDLQRFNDIVEKSDVIVVASPLYFCSLPAQMKAIVDRSQPQWIRKYVLQQKHKEEGKTRKGLFLLCSASNEQRYFECSRSIIKSFFNVRDIEYLDGMFITGVDKEKDILNKQDVFEQAKKMILKAIK